MEEIVVFPSDISKALKEPQEADHELLIDIGIVLKGMTQKQQRFLGLYAMGYSVEEIGDMVDIRNPQVTFQRNVQRVATLINLKKEVVVDGKS